MKMPEGNSSKSNNSCYTYSVIPPKSNECIEIITVTKQSACVCFPCIVQYAMYRCNTISRFSVGALCFALMEFAFTFVISLICDSDRIGSPLRDDDVPIFFLTKWFYSVESMVCSDMSYHKSSTNDGLQNLQQRMFCVLDLWTLFHAPSNNHLHRQMNERRIDWLIDESIDPADVGIISSKGSQTNNPIVVSEFLDPLCYGMVVACYSCYHTRPSSIRVPPLSWSSRMYSDDTTM